MLSQNSYESQPLWLAFNGNYNTPIEHLRALEKVLANKEYCALLYAKNAKPSHDNLSNKKSTDSKAQLEFTASQFVTLYEKLIDEVVKKHYLQSYQILIDLQLPPTFFLTANEKSKLTAESDYFNALNYHVCSEILSQSTARERAIVYERWIHILKRSFQAGNHTTVQALIGPLRSNQLTRAEIPISEQAKRTLDLFGELAGKPGKSPFFNLTLQRATNNADNAKFRDFATVPIQSLMGLIILNNEKINGTKIDEWAFKYNAAYEFLKHFHIINTNAKKAISDYHSFLRRIAFKKKKEAHRRELAKQLTLSPPHQTDGQTNWWDETEEDKKLPDVTLNAETRFAFFADYAHDIVNPSLFATLGPSGSALQKQTIQCLFEFEELVLAAENPDEINDKLITAYRKLALKFMAILKNMQTKVSSHEFTSLDKEFNNYITEVQNNEEKYKPIREASTMTRHSYSALIMRLQDIFIRELEKFPLSSPVYSPVNKTADEISNLLYEASDKVKPKKATTHEEKPLADELTNASAQLSASIFALPVSTALEETAYDFIKNCKEKDEDITVYLKEYAGLELSEEQRKNLAKEITIEKSYSTPEKTTLVEISPGTRTNLSHRKESTSLESLEKLQKLLETVLALSPGYYIQETFNAVKHIKQFIKYNPHIYTLYIKLLNEKKQSLLKNLQNKIHQEEDKYKLAKKDYEKTKKDYKKESDEYQRAKTNKAQRKQAFKIARKNYQNASLDMSAQLDKLERVCTKLIDNQVMFVSFNTYPFLFTNHPVTLQREAPSPRPSPDIKAIEGENIHPKPRTFSIVQLTKDLKRRSWQGNQKNRDIITQTLSEQDTAAKTDRIEKHSVKIVDAQLHKLHNASEKESDVPHLNLRQSGSVFTETTIQTARGDEISDLPLTSDSSVTTSESTSTASSARLNSAPASPGVRTPKQMYRTTSASSLTNVVSSNSQVKGMSSIRIPSPKHSPKDKEISPKQKMAVRSISPGTKPGSSFNNNLISELSFINEINFNEQNSPLTATLKQRSNSSGTLPSSNTSSDAELPTLRRSSLQGSKTVTAVSVFSEKGNIELKEDGSKRLAKSQRGGLISREEIKVLKDSEVEKERSIIQKSPIKPG